MAEKGVPSEASSEIRVGRVPQTLTFSLKGEITRENIEGLLERVYKLAGCRNCGLLGFDVRLQVVDPAIRTHFKGIESFADVQVGVSPHA